MKSNGGNNVDLVLYKKVCVPLFVIFVYSGIFPVFPERTILSAKRFFGIPMAAVTGKEGKIFLSSSEP